MVFLKRDIPTALLDTTLGFAAGVMIAASSWSLLALAIEYAAVSSLPALLPVAVGFVQGVFFLYLADQFLPHFHIDRPS